MTCPSCGATVRADAAWCGQCHATMVEPVPEWRADQEGDYPRRRVDPRRPLPAAEPTYSRWRGGTTSMGPVGRVVWTVVMLGFGVLFLVSGNPFAFGPWWLIAVPLVLRSVWANKRIT